MPDEVKEPKKGDEGVCGFCGNGGGYLGEMGDDFSMKLLSAVRSGIPGHWTYHSHQFALEYNRHQYIQWCGQCDEGLAHKYQRHNDLNLAAMIAGYKLMNQLDPCQWWRWNMTAEEREATIAESDDPGVHIEKMSRETAISLIEREINRRKQPKDESNGND